MGGSGGTRLNCLVRQLEIRARLQPPIVGMQGAFFRLDLRKTYA
jgi:hypothetical protein